MRMVVERPGDRHLDQAGLLTEAVGLAELDLVAAPGAIGNVVGAHQAGVVEKALLDQQIDGVRAQIPRRRAVTARSPPGKLPDILVGADEIGFLLVAGLVGVRNVRPRVMADLVARLGDGGALLWPALD